MPILLLLLVGSVYGDETIEGVDGATYLVAGLLGFSVVATAFAGLAISTVLRRENGVLKRVRGTPIPPALYLAAAITSTLLVIALDAVVHVAVGRVVLGAAWPQSLVALGVTLLVGTAAFAALGLAVTGFVRGAEGSSAVISAVYLPMAFISGTFFSAAVLPGALQVVAEVLPLTHLLRSMRSAFTESSDLSTFLAPLAVLTSWGAAGVAIAAKTFRWEPLEG